MRVIIEGQPEEVAALVLVLQGRQTKEVKLNLDGEKLSQAVFGATHDKTEGSSC